MKAKRRQSSCTDVKKILTASQPSSTESRSGNNSPISNTSNDVPSRPHGLLSKVTSFRTLRKNKKNNASGGNSPLCSAASRRNSKKADDDNPLNGLPVSKPLVPSPASGPASGSSPYYGSVGRAYGRSLLDRGSSVSMSLSGGIFFATSPPSPLSASASCDHIPTRALPKDVKGDISKFQLEGYARKYFKSRKKGIFKRQVPIQELLTFQKKEMTAPLLDLKNKPELCVTAIRMFQLILTYQGLKKPLRPGEDIGVARELLQEALREGQIRDEIYCQICKQTCDTPSPDILYKGWELMALCCVTFPPTRNFEEWLRKHLWEQTKRADAREAVFAMYCVRKLDLICDAPPSLRMPSNYEIEKIREAPLYNSPFGVSLQELLEKQMERGVDAPVPEILMYLCQGISRLNGRSALGIFRVKGDNKRVHELKADIECCNYSLETSNPHDLANLLKMWLRELAEPLIPFELQPKCLAAGDNVREVLKIVNKLPPTNKATMKYVVEFLQEFLSSESEARTKMSAGSIASIFAPNLLRAPDNQISVESAKLEQDFVRTVILHWRA